MDNIQIKDYFSKKEFKELLEALKNKYINYGSCIGTINITAKTLEEALKLSMFLSKNIKVNVKTNIKIVDIQKSLDDSKFEGVMVDDLVLLFFPNIKSKKQIKIETEDYVNSKLNECKAKYKNLSNLFSNLEAIKKIKYLILRDEKLLDNILKSLEFLLKEEVTYLSIFASTITGNPHYYDIDTHNCNVLLQFICYLFDLEFSLKRSIKKQILESVGILIDEVSNDVITYNLSGNIMLDSFKSNLTPLTLNLANIRKMDDIKCENDILLIVENPSFLSKVIDKKINYSVVITSGNSNFVIYKLLDKIKNTKIYFNGDFDPEGLLIAQNIKNKYSLIEFIGYDEIFYNSGISEQEISEVRLKKLDNITDTNLCFIKDLLILNRKASYQEPNYDMILNYLEKNCS